MKKILLVRSNTSVHRVPPPEMPSGLLYLASLLHQYSHHVKIYDLSFDSIDELKEDIKDYDFLGISMLSYCRSQMYDLIKVSKKINPDIKIIVGGVHASALKDKIKIEFPEVDEVICGEGELKFCTYVEKGETLDPPLLDLDAIPFPKWDLITLDRYYMQFARNYPDYIVNGLRLGDLRYAPIIATRGCFGKCVFCNTPSHWNNKIRFRSGKNIADEVELLYNRYGVQLFSFNDDAFPSSKSQLFEFTSEIKKRGLKIAWKCDSRVDTLSDEMLKEMHETGCFMIAVGIESGSEKIHKILGKRINLEKAKDTISLIKKNNILAYALLMVGNVGETIDTIIETKGWLMDAKPDLYSYVLGVMICPGTELQRIAGVDDDYYLRLGEDGLPLYLDENSIEEMAIYAEIINSVPRKSIK